MTSRDRPLARCIFLVSPAYRIHFELLEHEHHSLSTQQINSPKTTAPIAGMLERGGEAGGVGVAENLLLNPLDDCSRWMVSGLFQQVELLLLLVPCRQG